MMEGSEKWVEVKGFPKYLVSSRGRVINSYTDVLVAPKFLNGRLYVSLTNQYGISASTSVHRLVAVSFSDLDATDKEVNHIDGDRTNNRLDNLEIVTPEENKEHAYRMGLMRRPRSVINLDTGEIYVSLSEAGRKLGLLAAPVVPKDVRENGGKFKSGGCWLELVP